MCFVDVHLQFKLLFHCNTEKRDDVDNFVNSYGKAGANMEQVKAYLFLRQQILANSEGHLGKNGIHPSPRQSEIFFTSLRVNFSKKSCLRL